MDHGDLIVVNCVVVLVHTSWRNLILLARHVGCDSDPPMRNAEKGLSNLEDPDVPRRATF